MNKNHFIFSYAGNKRNESKTIIENINFDDINNIIEPFCGSSAMSFNIWKTYKDKFNYYLNDYDKKLIEIYELLKSLSLDEIYLKLDYINKEINNSEEPKKFYLEIYKNPRNIFDYLYICKYSSFRRGLYREITKIISFVNNKELILFIEFIKSPNVIITNNDWKTIYDKYKNDEKTLFLIDPPYISSCNDFYQNKNTNLYEDFYLNPINNYKSKIYLILEDIWIIRLLFKDFISFKYEKKYEISKKQTNHLIISNN